MASTIANAQYTPGPVPTNTSDLPRYLKDEFDKIAAATSRLADGHLEISYAPPTRPRSGDFRNADGVQWNPGSGAGFYRFNGTTWVFLG